MAAISHFSFLRVWRLLKSYIIVLYKTRKQDRRGFVEVGDVNIFAEFGDVKLIVGYDFRKPVIEQLAPEELVQLERDLFSLGQDYFWKFLELNKVFTQEGLFLRYGHVAIPIAVSGKFEAFWDFSIGSGEESHNTDTALHL